MFCAFVLFCGGFLSFCLKETSNRTRGAHDAWNMIEMVIFCSLTLSLPWALFFLFQWKRHQTEKKKNVKDVITFFCWCWHVFTVCWLVNSSNVEGVWVFFFTLTGQCVYVMGFTKHTSVLEHPTYCMFSAHHGTVLLIWEKMNWACFL